MGCLVVQPTEATCLSSSTPSTLSTHLAGPSPHRCPRLTLGTASACHRSRPRPQDSAQGAQIYVAIILAWAAVTPPGGHLCLGNMADRVCLQKKETGG